MNTPKRPTQHGSTSVGCLDSMHPLPTGYIFESLGAHLTYRVVGPCCRLYDREQLPWPCCRIQWHSKEPSWRRIGRRFVADLSTRKHPSYCVEIIGQSYRSEPIVMTLYTVTLVAQLQNWWHTKRLDQTAAIATWPPDFSKSSERTCSPDWMQKKSPNESPEIAAAGLEPVTGLEPAVVSVAMTTQRSPR